MRDRDDMLDPRGLIREAFRIEGIAETDCRSIFFDWALGMPDAADLPACIRALLDRHADEPEDHPMRRVLLEGASAEPSRRGRRGRRGANHRANGDG